MTLQKAQFQRLDKKLKPITPGLEVQFNPTEFTLNKGVQLAEIAIPGLDTPILQFVRGQTETLTLDLFFDTTDAGMGDSATPVTTLTDTTPPTVPANLQATSVLVTSATLIWSASTDNVAVRARMCRRDTIDLRNEGLSVKFARVIRVVPETAM